MAYQSGEYPQPLLRTTYVQAPMVSGYATVRLCSGINQFINTQGLDNTTLVLIENTGHSTYDTNFTLQIKSTADPSSSGARTNVGGAYQVVPGGRKTVTFTPSQEFLEFYCTAGGGNVRAQISSRISWEEMAFSKTDPFYPPQLWQVVNGLTAAQLPNTGS